LNEFLFSAEASRGCAIHTAQAIVTVWSENGG
jgi:hypothetical protein